MAWKSEVLASVSHLLNRDMVKLQDVWDVIGIQEDKRLERMGPLKMHNERLLGQMIHKEELMKEQLEEAIKNWQGELQTLCSELHLDPYKADESSTLLQLEKELRNKVKALLQEKNGRMEECEMLLKEDQALCTDLCKTPYFLPSLQELEELKNHLERRLATLFELQSEITQLMADVEYVPDPTFEKDAVLEQENLLVLSDGNIQSLNVLCHQLGMKKQELMATQESLKEQISSLRNRLQIPLEQQNMCATGSICQVNRVLQQELDQLQQMMTKHIKQNVTGIRQELHTYWDKSFYSQKQREEFAFLLDENFTEELLKVHDEELLKITLYYEKHQELFDNIEKWQRWWKLLLECEKKALDPKKYANRGGSLLREVRECSQLNKKLPKLEEELKLCIEKWETEQGCPFLVNGQKFVTCIANQWEQHRLQREQGRCVKQEGGIVCKTLLKRPIGKPDAPHSKIRKLNGPSNFTLVNSGGSTCNQAGKPPLPARKAPKASKLPDQLQRPSLQNDEASQPSTSNSVVSSYSVFLAPKASKLPDQLQRPSLQNDEASQPSTSNSVVSSYSVFLAPKASKLPDQLQRPSLQNDEASQPSTSNSVVSSYSVFLAPKASKLPDQLQRPSLQNDEASQPSTSNSVVSSYSVFLAPKASKLPDQLQRPSLQNDEASQPSTSNSVVSSYSVFLAPKASKLPDQLQRPSLQNDEASQPSTSNSVVSSYSVFLLPDQLQRPSLQDDEASQPSTSNSVVTSYSVFLHDSSGKSDPGSAQLNSTTLDNP